MQQFSFSVILQEICNPYCFILSEYRKSSSEQKHPTEINEGQSISHSHSRRRRHVCVVQGSTVPPSSHHCPTQCPLWLELLHPNNKHHTVTWVLQTKTRTNRLNQNFAELEKSDSSEEGTNQSSVSLSASEDQGPFLFTRNRYSATRSVPETRG